MQQVIHGDGGVNPDHPNRKDAGTVWIFRWRGLGYFSGKGGGYGGGSVFCQTKRAQIFTSKPLFLLW
jgi:hypothetical protein